MLVQKLVQNDYTCVLWYQENYGKADEACVAKVKELYKVLDLQVPLCLSVLWFCILLGTKIVNVFDSSEEKS